VARAIGRGCSRRSTTALVKLVKLGESAEVTFKAARIAACCSMPKARRHTGRGWRTAPVT
jgi:hypothetical protein